MKSTGLKQVDDTLDSVSKNLSELNEKVMANQQRGWGSEAQTKELREQLRSMQQLLQMTERMARAKGVKSDSFGEKRREIGSMQREVSDMRTYRNPISGKIHDNFGAGAANGFDKAVSRGSQAASGLVAFDFLNTLRSGINTGTQLSYGYGDLGKRMAPEMNSQKYGKDTLKSMQGYGYTDTDILQSHTTYGAATGKMDTGKFNEQMRAIGQTGSNYGLDLSSVTENFASMYKGGVTGGTKEQMSPQEYANLVANAVNRGNMQGKEMQVIGQIQQLVQMGVSSSGDAGDIKALTAFLAMGNKSGNQAFSNNLPQYVNAINSGMTAPGGGYAGQALMMQAIGGKDMGYYETQVQAAKGAFGMNEKNGKTNIENVMTHLSKSFGEEDIDQKSVMFSTLFPGMNAAQSKEFIQNYTNEDGSFKEGGMEVLKKQMNQEVPTKSKNETDEARINTRKKEHEANEAGMDTLKPRSYLDSLQGELLDEFGEPMVYGAGAALGASSLYTGYRVGKGLFNAGKNFMNRGKPPVPGRIPPVPTGGVPPMPTRVPTGGPLALPPGSGSAPVPTGSPSRVIPFPNRAPFRPAPSVPGAGLRFGLGLGTLGTSIIGGYMNDKINEVNTPENRERTSKLFKEELTTVNGKPIKGMGYMEYINEQRKSLLKNMKRMMGISDDSGSPEEQKTGSTNGQPSGSQTSTGVPLMGSTQGLTGAALAPLVASTIVALGPYMAQLKPIIGGGTDGNQSKPITDLVYRGQEGGTRDLMYRGNDATNGGLRLASYNPNSPLPNNPPTMRSTITGEDMPAGSSAKTTNITGKDEALKAISYWSQKYGIPDYIGQSIAYSESSFNPNANIIDSNNAYSTGLFQLNQKGQGYGYDPEALKDPYLNSEIGLKPIAAAYNKAKEMGVEEGPGMAKWVAEHSGHPGGNLENGYHSPLSDKIYENAKGILNGSIKVTGEVTVNVNQPDGSTTAEKVQLNASWAGIGA